LGQALAVFQAFNLAKPRIQGLLSQKLKFWESLYPKKAGLRPADYPVSLGLFQNRAPGYAGNVSAQSINFGTTLL
jgi:hypothetical protein